MATGSRELQASSSTCYCPPLEEKDEIPEEEYEESFDAEIAYREGSDQLQYQYVVGKCRGCTRNTRLVASNRIVG
jgi:hypothetical protein